MNSTKYVSRALSGLTALSLLSMTTLSRAQDAVPAPTTSGEQARASPETTTAAGPRAMPAGGNVTPTTQQTESSSTFVAEGGNQYHVDTTTRTVYPNRKLLTAGTLMLVGGYAPAAIIAATQENNGDKFLYYPVAGPWMYLAKRSHHSAGTKTLLVLDGILQDVGAVELLLAFMIPEKEQRRWFEFGKNDVHLAPRVAHNQAGLWASGNF